MANFNQAFDKLIVNEGGYSSNSSGLDKGGETYKGIARKFWPQWSGWVIIDAKKQKDNFPMTLEVDRDLQLQVKAFYLVNFWEKVKGEYIIDQDVAFSVFDFAVNAGSTAASKIAQRAVGANADGIIGKETLGLINSIDKELFMAKFDLAKIAKYVDIVKNDPSQSTFFYGWICRVIKH